MLQLASCGSDSFAGDTVELLQNAEQQNMERDDADGDLVPHIILIMAWQYGMGTTIESRLLIRVPAALTTDLGRLLW